jgi:predicted homoserine dehydrogenase-like protein
LKRLINETEFMGFKTVLAGNIKGYLDYHSNPTAIIPEAEKRFMDKKMCVSFTDGTKLNIEMALIANGIGAKTIVPGMLGLEVKDINQFPSFFNFDALWDGDTPIVDYTIKTYPPGGVFVVGYIDHPHQRQTLAWYPPNMGKGPFYVFHRPYHLGHFEYLASVAEAYLDGWAVLKPDFGLKTNVYAYAKKDLKKGELLDGIGGYCSYGLIENTIDNQQKPGLPICLADEVSLKRDITKDEKIFVTDANLERLGQIYSKYDGSLKSIVGGG